MKNFKENRLKILFIALYLVPFFLLVPLYQANAAHEPGHPRQDILTAAWNSTTSGSAKLVKNIIDIQGTIWNFTSNILLQAAGNWLAFTASILDWMVSVTNFFPEVVRVIWTIFRDFANLFFILILVIVAFATIFDNQKYNYREVLPKLIIAALLINFSYVIGTTIVDISDILSSAMLRQATTVCTATNAGTSSITTCFMNGTGVHGITALDGKGLALTAASAAAAGAGTLTTLFFLLALIVVLSIVFLTAGIFLIVRMIVLWFLLMLSPLAWLASILPATRNFTNQWWQEFMGWAFFPVIYFFFLALGMGFINNRISNPNDFSKLDSTSSVGDIFSGVIGLNDLIFYLITLAIIGGGLFLSKKMGNMFGGSVVSTAGRIQGGVQKYAYQFSGAKTRVEGAQQGLAAKREQIKEKGLFGIPGAQQSRLTQAKFAERFGARGAQDKAIAAEVAKSKGQYQNIKSEQELRDRMNQTSNDIDKLALAERLKEEGILTPKESLETYKNYQRIGAELAAQQFAKGIDFSKDKMHSDERTAWETATNDPIIKRKIEMAKAESGDYRSASTGELSQAATIFGNNRAEQKAFLDKIAKINFIAATQAKADIESLGKSAEERQTARDKAITDELRKMNLDKVLELSPNSLEAILKNDDAKRTIEGKLTPENIRMITSKASALQLDVLETVISTKKKTLEEEENRKLQKQADAQAKGMQPFVDAIQNLVNKKEHPPPPKPKEPGA